MHDQAQMERARQHLQNGEKLVMALKEAIGEQEAEGKSTEATERLLQEMLTTLDRMRNLCR